MPRVMDSATFSAAWRHTLTVRNSGSPVLPLAALTVPVAGRAGDPEPGHRLAARGEPQLGIIHQVAGDGQRGLVHDLVSFLPVPLTCGSAWSSAVGAGGGVLPATALLPLRAAGGSGSRGGRRPFPQETRAPLTLSCGPVSRANGN